MSVHGRIASKAGAGLTMMSLVIALGFTSPTLAQKGEAPEKLEGPKGDGLPPIISTPAGAPADSGLPPAPADPITAPIAAGPLEPKSAPPDPMPARDAALTPAAAPPVSSGDATDPEKAAQEFMDKTRQEADAAVKSLNAEAESLRARLKKVEAGLKRWQSLQAALDESSGQRTARKAEWRQKDEPEVSPRRRVAGQAFDRDGGFPLSDSVPAPRLKSRADAAQKK